MTEADEGTAIANAEAFCRTLEAIARTLPKVALATHPALGAGAACGAEAGLAVEGALQRRRPNTTGSIVY